MAARDSKNNLNFEKYGSVVVLAPDDDSGKDFKNTLAKAGLKAEYRLIDVPPRVVTDETGNSRLTKDIDGVSMALSDAIEEAVKTSEKPVLSIACNTLSLDVFIKKAELLLKKKGYKSPEDYLLVTPIHALDKKFKDKTRHEGPLLLGTIPMMEHASFYELKSPVNMAEKSRKEQNYSDEMFWYKIANLSQELIWRVKAVGGSDYSTAPNGAYEDIKSESKLLDRGKELFELLKEKKEYMIALVCTELPILYKKLDKSGLMKEVDPDGKFVFTNPADLVTEEIKSILGEK